eukprot:SAG22_NODE_4650_length_1205_cov_1.310407_1_plen_301_part_01
MVDGVAPCGCRSGGGLRPPPSARPPGRRAGLTAAELGAYRGDGLVFPKRLLSPEQAEGYRQAWERCEAAAPIAGSMRYKSHLLFTFVDEIMRLPAVLDAVEDILGPDIMVWNSNLYPKEPGEDRFISWHQDSAHWGLSNDKVVTVWVALSAATPENGCMLMLRGSHRAGKVPHHDTWDGRNILTRGQTVSVLPAGVDEQPRPRAGSAAAQQPPPPPPPESQTDVLSVALGPGECSLHHIDMVHASPPNVTTDQRRLALAIRYMTPATRQLHSAVDYATLVRGGDRHRHFRPERRPRQDQLR